MIPSSERYEKSLVSKMKDLQVTEFWAERWSDWMGQDSSLHAIPRQYAARHNQLWYQSQMVRISYQDAHLTIERFFLQKMNALLAIS
jgi:hypothetical protein